MFVAATPQVTSGDVVELRWYTFCAANVVIEPEIGAVSSIGVLHLRPTKTTTYRLKVDSPWSDWVDETKEITVEVRPRAPKANVEVVPKHIWMGDPVTVRWRTSDATRISLNERQNLPSSGELTVPNILQSTTFKLMAEAEGAESATAEAQISVAPIPTIPDPPSVPDFATLFDKAAPIIEFPNKEPKPDRKKPFSLPVVEQSKLDTFAKFLLQNPGIHMQVFSNAAEYAKDATKQAAVTDLRRYFVTNYLVRSGIPYDRLQLGTPPQPVANIKDSKVRERLGRSVTFKYAGVPPTLAARVLPSRIDAGESAVIVWNTQNADVVQVIGSAQLQPQGIIRVQPGQTSTLTVTARNKYDLENKVQLLLLVNPPPPPAAPPPAPSPAVLFRTNLDDIFFDRGSALLTTQAKTALQHASEWLSTSDARNFSIKLEASVEPAEPASLAKRRADTCRAYLASLGIGAFRMRTVATGGPPLADVDQAENSYAWRAFNRRVQIVFDDSPPIRRAPPPNTRKTGKRSLTPKRK